MTIAVAALLAGCSSEAGPFDGIEGDPSVEVREPLPGMTEACARQVRLHGIDSVMLTPTGRCYETTPPRRWRGLWQRGWEWTNFCPAPAEVCPIASDEGDVWLDFREGVETREELGDGLFAIEFIGRRTKHPGSFGHLGQYDHEMIGDRLISIRKVSGTMEAKE